MLLLLAPDAALLLVLQLVVQEIERLLVRLGGADDREHALAGLVVRRLRNGDLRAGQASDFGNLGTLAANDAPDHV